MHRITTAVLATLLALGTLSACGDQDPPTPADPSPTVTSPSTTPGPVVPTMPPAAFRHDKAGAIAFTKYYWEMANYAMAALDPQSLARLQSKDCGQCTGAVRWITEVKRAGGQIIGGDNHVTIRKVDSLGHGRYWFVTFRVTSAAGRVAHAGNLDKQYVRGSSPGTFTLTSEGDWRILDWRSR